MLVLSDVTSRHVVNCCLSLFTEPCRAVLSAEKDRSHTDLIELIKRKATVTWRPGCHINIVKSSSGNWRVLCQPLGKHGLLQQLG